MPHETNVRGGYEAHNDYMPSWACFRRYRSGRLRHALVGFWQDGDIARRDRSDRGALEGEGGWTHGRISSLYQDSITVRVAVSSMNAWTIANTLYTPCSSTLISADGGCPTCGLEPMIIELGDSPNTPISAMFPPRPTSVRANVIRSAFTSGTSKVKKTFPMPKISESLFSRSPPTLQFNSYIKSFGVELECLLPDPGVDDFRHQGDFQEFLRKIPRSEAHGDGSIRNKAGMVTREVTFWTTTLDEMNEWLHHCYDNFKAETNPSCGFHIHLVSPPAYRYGYFTKDYWEGFYKAYSEFANSRGKSAPRYLGRMSNEWSSTDPWSWSEAVRPTTRYRAINTSAITRHPWASVEHRILPNQETAEEAMNSLSWLLETSTKLLSLAKQDLFSREENLVVPPGELDTARQITLTTKYNYIGHLTAAHTSSDIHAIITDTIRRREE